MKTHLLTRTNRLRLAIESLGADRPEATLRAVRNDYAQRRP